MTAKSLQKLFAGFKGKHLMVIGDVMLDTYYLGSANRISPEAPVPVVQVKHIEHKPGGAANVALNLKALGASVSLIAVCGNDPGGALLAGLIKNENIPTNGLIGLKGRITTQKTRVISQSHQMLRIDHEQTHALNPAEQRSILGAIRSEINRKKPDAIIFEDYDKGLLDKKLIDEIIRQAKKLKIAVCVDPKKQNFLHYHDVDLFKPNLRELREGLLLDHLEITEKNLRKAHKALHKLTGNKQILVTLSEYGAFYAGQKESGIVPACKRNIADVSGAGDTVIAVAALCMVSGCTLPDIAAIANIAGGLVCESPGVKAIDAKTLLSECIALLK